MKHPSLFIMISFLLASCGSGNALSASPTTPAISTVISIATSTTMPTVTPSPIPIPVTYVYGNEVTAAERAEFELGMQSSYNYLSEQGLGSPGPQTVIALYDVEQMTDISYPLYGPEFHSTKDQVRSMWKGAAGINPSDAASATTNTPPSTADVIILPTALPTGGGPDPLAAIFVLTSIPKEFYNYPCYKVEYMAHDIWHTMQRKWAKLPLRSGYPMPRTGPEWLKEGSAQYFSFKVAAKAHPDQCEYTREFGIKTQDFFNVPLKLSSMESSESLATAQQDVFTLGAFAVDYLVGKSPKGIVSLKDFYEGIGQGLSWDDAFQAAFGQSVDAFYAEFPVYQQQVFFSQQQVLATEQRGFLSLIDASFCTDSDSSGDFTIKCLGKWFPNSMVQGNEFRFEVSGFDLLGTPDNLLGVSSNCQINNWSSAPPSFLDILIDPNNQPQRCTLVLSPVGSGKSAQVTFDLVIFDSSICIPQSDPQAKCLGLIEKDGMDAYEFEIGFGITPEVYQWKIESTCKITKLAALGDTLEMTNKILISVDNSTRGNCQATFTFTDNKQVTVEFSVP